jgi:hypothetical protein
MGSAIVDNLPACLFRISRDKLGIRSPASQLAMVLDNL